MDIVNGFLSSSEIGLSVDIDTSTGCFIKHDGLQKCEFISPSQLTPQQGDYAYYGGLRHKQEVSVVDLPGSWTFQR